MQGYFSTVFSESLHYSNCLVSIPLGKIVAPSVNFYRIAVDILKVYLLSYIVVSSILNKWIWASYHLYGQIFISQEYASEIWHLQNINLPICVHRPQTQVLGLHSHSILWFLQKHLYCGDVDLSLGNIKTIFGAYKELNDGCNKLVLIIIRCQGRIHNLK